MEKNVSINARMERIFIDLMNLETNASIFYINFDENIYFTAGLSKNTFKFPLSKELTIES